MKLSRTHFLYLSNQIESGYAVSAIATASRYLDKNCPLMLALITKAKARLRHHGCDSLDQILADQVLSADLLQIQIKQFDGKQDKRIKLNIPKNFSKIKIKSLSRRTTKRTLHNKRFGIYSLALSKKSLSSRMRS